MKASAATAVIALFLATAATALALRESHGSAHSI